MKTVNTGQEQALRGEVVLVHSVAEEHGDKIILWHVVLTYADGRRIRLEAYGPGSEGILMTEDA